MCEKCKTRRKFTIEDAKKLAVLRGGICLSTKYINSRTKLVWKCGNGRIWEATYTGVQQGNWCPKCNKNTLANCYVLAKAKNGFCLSTEYITSKHKLVWKCESGHTWEATYGNIYMGKWCPYCSGQIQHTIEDCKELAKNRGGFCLSTEYKNNRQPLLWKCREGHELLSGAQSSGGARC